VVKYLLCWKSSVDFYPGVHLQPLKFPSLHTAFLWHTARDHVNTTTVAPLSWLFTLSVTVLTVVYAISNAAYKIKCKENMQIVSDAPTCKVKGLNCIVTCLTFSVSLVPQSCVEVPKVDSERGDTPSVLAIILERQEGFFLIPLLLGIYRSWKGKDCPITCQADKEGRH